MLLEQLSLDEKALALENIKGAIKRIQEKGWRKGGGGLDGFGPRCLLESLFVVEPSSSVLIREALNLKEGESLVEWNDAPGRTQEEVLGILRKVELELGGTNG